MDESPAPGLVDLAVADVATHGEVDVQAVTTRVPLRYPEVGEGLAEALTQAAEELADVLPELYLVMAALGVGEGPEPVQSVGRRIPPDAGAGTPGRLRSRPFGVLRLTPASPVDLPPWACALERTACLGRIGVEGDHPSSLLQLPEFRCYYK